MLKLNIKSLSIKKKKKKYRISTKNHIPNHTSCDGTNRAKCLSRGKEDDLSSFEIHSPIQRYKPRRMMFRKTDDDLNISRQSQNPSLDPPLFSRENSREKNEISSFVAALSVNHRLLRPLFAPLRGYYLRDTPLPIPHCDDESLKPSFHRVSLLRVGLKNSEGHGDIN